MTASANLRTINDLVDRMGRITASLRAFARRSDDKGQAQLSKAVNAALQLLAVRLEQSGLILHQAFADAALGIDQTRLEQILVNLIGNALCGLKVRSSTAAIACWCVTMGTVSTMKCANTCSNPFSRPNRANKASVLA